MKKRSSPQAKVRTNRVSFRGSIDGSFGAPEAKPLPRPRSTHRPGDDASLTIVKGPQFQALLDLIDNPPQVSEEHRREVAAARLWK